ncbi:hypothetical protein E2562_029635 [Oryza meyeriana var. granulata]|uniref:Flowering-promoting factor 1-like protein 1 n=1 Tax=Oryza meyeriana var. granulata TaxID=110450 RepID=A0A6G1E407_9ORYZ|nr:hypothetical protein E2562_029635 [Oryza meyeriana var. granulata]
MSGVWVFKNGVVVASYAALEARLTALGWERYYEDPSLFQFHKRGSLDLISLPADFAAFSSVHMYDIVVKNRDSFRVVDA